MPEDNLTNSIPDRDEKYIPHMIYLLSFVLDVGGQFNLGSEPISDDDREKLRNALGFGREVQDSELKTSLLRMDNELDREIVGRSAEVIADAFQRSISYPPEGACPSGIDTLVTLAKQWRACATSPQ